MGRVDAVIADAEIGDQLEVGKRVDHRGRYLAHLGDAADRLAALIRQILQLAAGEMLHVERRLQGIQRIGVHLAGDQDGNGGQV